MSKPTETPWRGWTINKPQPSNAQKQVKARKKMSEFQAQTGIPLEAFEADQAAQRAKVRARYGLDAA